MAKAAVMTAYNAPLEIHEIEPGDPNAGEIRVKMLASGVCHSDYSMWQGSGSLPLPIVLGHEGAAEVLELGKGVTNVTVGDHVVLSAIPQCGECVFCRRGQYVLCVQGFNFSLGGMTDGTTRMTLDGQPLHHMCSIGTFSEESIVPAISAVSIPAHIPVAPASLIGCAVATGVGAARNVASIEAGDSVAVVGCGGVGLNVIQGAKLAGAGRIFAVDRVAWKLDLAKQFGATDTVLANGSDPVSQVLEATGGFGVDVAFEAIGSPEAEVQMVAMTRPGGQSVFVGMPHSSKQVTFADPTASFIGSSKTLRGCLYGSTHIVEDFPSILASYEKGELKLEELISKEIKLEDLNEAFSDMESGQVARSVIVYD